MDVSFEIEIVNNCNLELDPLAMCCVETIGDKKSYLFLTSRARVTMLQQLLIFFYEKKKIYFFCCFINSLKLFTDKWVEILQTIREFELSVHYNNEINLNGFIFINVKKSLSNQWNLWKVSWWVYFVNLYRSLNWSICH